MGQRFRKRGVPRHRGSRRPEHRASASAGRSQISPLQVPLAVEQTPAYRVLADAVVLPITHLGGDGKHRATLKVQDGLPQQYKVFLDTGAPYSMATNRVVEQEGLIPSGVLPVGGLGGDQMELRPCYWALLAFLDGPAHMRVLRVPVRVRLLREDLGCDVLLGLDAILQGDLRIPPRIEAAGLTRRPRPAIFTIDSEWRWPLPKLEGSES